MECYTIPSEASTTEDVDTTTRDIPYGAKLLVDRNLNANLVDLESTARVEAIANELAAVGLMDMGLNFLPRRKPWLKDRCIWRIHQDGREVQYRTDLILEQIADCSRTWPSGTCDTTQTTIWSGAV